MYMGMLIKCYVMVCYVLSMMFRSSGPEIFRWNDTKWRLPFTFQPDFLETETDKHSLTLFLCMYSWARRSNLPDGFPVTVTDEPLFFLIGKVRGGGGVCKAKQLK